jgi:hypothetical protein
LSPREIGPSGRARDGSRKRTCGKSHAAPTDRPKTILHDIPHPRGVVVRGVPAGSVPVRASPRQHRHRLGRGFRIAGARGRP